MKNKLFLIGILVSLFFTVVLAETFPNLTGVAMSNLNRNVDCERFAKFIKYGDGFRNGKVEDVKNLQEALRQKGYFDHESTGYFGIITKRAVQKYQKDNGIIATGNVFKLTLGQLVKHFCHTDNSGADSLLKGPVNSYCKVWNDGCNTCFKSSSTTTDVGCTKMYCENKSEPYCKEYFKDAPITGECKSWYDGCNWCGKENASSSAMCTMRACQIDSQEKAYCSSYFSTTTLIKACPSEKIINLMPVVCVTTPCLPQPSSEYYIYNGVRKEISDFDSEYVKKYCEVKETKVY